MLYRYRLTIEKDNPDWILSHRLIILSYTVFQEPVIATDGNGGKPKMYVDGGILSIFPLHIFDG